MSRPRGDCVTTVDDAVAAIGDGMHVGIGGVLDRNRPMALCRALAVRRPTGLRVSSFLAGAEVELLARAGALAELTTGYLDPRAGATVTEDAIADGTVELREVSEHLFVGGLLAAANGLPFWPTRGATGSDLVERLGLRDVTCPYTGVPVLAVPATPLDVVLLHASAATTHGAVVAPERREFLDDADVTLARAARRVIVSTDRLLDPADAVGHAVLAPFEVDVVVAVEPEDRR